MKFPFCIKWLHIGQSDVHFYFIQRACSKYHVFAISFEHHFISSYQEKSLQLLMKSRYETDSTDSNNLISLLVISLSYQRIPKKLPFYQFLHSDLCVKKLISAIINCHMMLLCKRIWHWKFDGIKVIGHFFSCLEAVTRQCPPKQLFFWSWINPLNYVTTCMLMFNIKNLFKSISFKKLVEIAFLESE